MDFSTVKNIVFDLGGVIINIDFDKTYQALGDLSGISLEESRKIAKEKELFLLFETGQIPESEFFTLLRTSFKEGTQDEEIRNAWNALLMDIPIERIELIKNLRKKYKLFLLSNTNFTHILEVNKILAEAVGVDDLKHLFDKVYYSYEMKLVKPNVDIYKNLCQDAGINPAETVFIDDSPLNLDGAREAGLEVLHATHQNTILELLKDA